MTSLVIRLAGRSLLRTFIGVEQTWLGEAENHAIDPSATLPFVELMPRKMMPEPHSAGRKSLV